MAYIGWGKPRFFVKNISKGGSIRELPNVVEDTFDITTEQGDKLEAKIEGGTNEDVKYKNNTNTITLDIRVFKGRKKPFADVNGVVSDEFEFWMQPEDPAVPAGIHCSRCRVATELKGTAADGITYTYTFEPLDNGEVDACQVGTVTVEEAGGNISNIQFTELEEETDEAA
ncbi:MAG: hypothetical protein NC035_08345 [Bacteroides sp.]|nr:hypothetical protein [Bacteroides sp.]